VVIDIGVDQLVAIQLRSVMRDMCSFVDRTFTGPQIPIAVLPDAAVPKHSPGTGESTFRNMVSRWPADTHCCATGRSQLSYTAATAMTLLFCRKAAP